MYFTYFIDLFSSEVLAILINKDEVDQQCKFEVK